MLERKYEYLTALAREKHFARAAAACHVSQPALSAGIQQLEHELGITIVKRGRRFLGLTEQGEVVLAWAKRMQLEHKKLQEELRAGGDDRGGLLRLGVMNSTTPFVSIFSLAFQQHFPTVSLRITTQNPFEIQRGLEELSFDVAISYLADERGHYKHSHPLYRQEYYVLARKGRLFKNRKSVSWEELGQLPLCLYPPDTQVLGTEVAELLGNGEPGSRLETNAMFVLLDHVKTGKWASILPKPVLFMVAGSDEFDAIPLPRTAEAGCIGIAVPDRRPGSHLAEKFFEIATSETVLKRFYKFLHPSARLEQSKPIAHLAAVSR
jgi:DNA-binding transcriptional LysR family regulator